VDLGPSGGGEVIGEVDARSAGSEAARNSTTEIGWEAAPRLARVRYMDGASLSDADGSFLVDTLTGWIGTDGAPFGVLADGRGLKSTNAEYRARASRFFHQHRGVAFIALINVSPVTYVVVEMFRVGTGVQLKSCGDEASARAWLRAKGIAA
jgi:hypothetical protein